MAQFLLPVAGRLGPSLGPSLPAVHTATGSACRWQSSAAANLNGSGVVAMALSVPGREPGLQALADPGPEIPGSQPHPQPPARAGPALGLNLKLFLESTFTGRTTQLAHRALQDLPFRYPARATPGLEAA